MRLVHSGLSPQLSRVHGHPDLLQVLIIHDGASIGQIARELHSRALLSIQQTAFQGTTTWKNCAWFVPLTGTELEKAPADVSVPVALVIHTMGGVRLVVESRE